MKFTMFRHYEGYSRSGYGSQTDCYTYIGAEGGKLLFRNKETENFILKVTPDEFIKGLDETYVNEYHRYQLSANENKEEIVNFIKKL